VCRSLLAYEGPARRLVAGLKYRNDRAALGWLADQMADLLRPAATSVVTWVPTTGRRRRRRGFDQAELLARALSRRWGLPCRPLLVRGAGPAQTGRSLSDRLVGVALAARGRGRRGSVPAAIVVVDDVTTTGATLRSAAAALRAGGATTIAAVTAAATPRRL
jgi:predicted amidophosphoribosyltransferase